VRTDATVAHLAWRELRRGALVVVASVAGLVAAIGAAFSATLSHPGSAGVNLGTLTSSPAVRALNGVPYDISTRGGFTVWRGSTIVLLVAGLWGALAATRILRGEEDAGRWDLLLAAPVRLTRSTAVHVAVLALVCLAVGAVVIAVMVAGGDPAGGSLLYGAGVALLTLTFTTLGACLAQVFGNRRLAAGASGALVGGAMVLRMAADASAGADWLRWLTPFGWVEELRAFARDRWGPLLLLAAAPCVLIALTVAFVRHRDVGAGLVRTSERAPARTRLLQNPARFAWRERLGGLVGWSVGLAFYGLIVGAITATGSKFIAENPSVAHATEQLGMTGLSTPAGFIASIAPFFAVAYAFYVVSSLGRCHEDEAAGRLDLPYAHPVTRVEWLSAQVLAATGATLVAVLATIVATWVGAVAGHAGVSFRDVAIATLNVLPAVAVFLGLAILLLGLRPGLTVPVGTGAAVAAYALTFVGPALHWPRPVVDVSPFSHLSNAPVSPVAWTALAVMLALAAVAAVLGFVTYERRDLE
jgi:ABC-2 type transport system permease protein